MTYDPIDTNETDTDADGSLTIDDLTATTVAGLDTSSGTGNEQIFTDGEGGLIAGGYSGIPVAFENLVAWYPFDSATYGGNNADDVTAREAYYGDSTAYDGTVNGATYQSSGGVTDINAGLNSGSFNFSSDDIDLGNNLTTTVFGNTAYSFGCWVNPDSLGTDGPIITGSSPSTTGRWFKLQYDGPKDVWEAQLDDSNNKIIINGGSPSLNSWTNLFVTHSESNGYKLFVDGSIVDSDSDNGSIISSDSELFIGRVVYEGGSSSWDGNIDDVRFYNRELSSSEISNIYNSTEP
jgi:hypothetical protein